MSTMSVGLLSGAAVIILGELLKRDTQTSPILVNLIVSIFAPAILGQSIPWQSLGLAPYDLFVASFAFFGYFCFLTWLDSWALVRSPLRYRRSSVPVRVSRMMTAPPMRRLACTL